MNDTNKHDDIKEPSLVSAAMNIGGVPEGFNEVLVDFFQFTNPGDTITGRLISKEYTTMRNNKVGKYTIIKPDGQRVAFLGSVKLDEQMKCVGSGQEVYIQYTGMEKLEGGNEMKLFRVFSKQSQYGYNR